ncbi:hypothetical protein HK104_008190 [Borealophlyctis nickersoniae]|nr:hypothetical protein HK104_008190 [Borealophlyctis nickersoniae]
MQFFRPADASDSSLDTGEKGKGDTVIARVGLVDIGNDRMINTLVIDRMEDELSHSTSVPEGMIKTQMNYGGKNSTSDTVHLEQDVTPVEEVGRTGPKKKTLVLCHGYGAGLGLFYRNFAALSEVPGYRTYALDWLGMANSSRPPFPAWKSGASDEEIVESAESFFVDSLEDWRKANKIDSMTLAGHSLGGYLSVAYALKYPSRVEKMILISPAGVGKPPEDLATPRRRGMLFSLFRTLWSYGVTPMSIVRLGGPWGPSLVRKYTSRRFAYLDQTDAEDLHGYMYHISAQPGSGEYALSRLLLPGAWARIPLHDRVKGLSMPTTFIYGTEDWMDYRAALSAVQNMKPATRVARVDGAGHHLYLDNPMGFNNAMITELTGRKPYGIPDVQYVHASQK